MSGGVWVFGYGSLVYRCGFEFESKQPGYVKGWERVFYQGSTDHRGTPEFPGRTVTLVPKEGAVTWGMAYRLRKGREEETLSYLEEREKQYDLRETLDIFHPSTEALEDGGGEGAGEDAVVVSGAICYIGTSCATNSNWLGHAGVEEIAQQIAAAVGPSGPNVEYLYGLAESMRELGVDDRELFRLEARVREIAAGEQ